MPIDSLPELPAGIVVDTGDDNIINRIAECFAHPLAASFKEALETLAAMFRGSRGGKIRLWTDFAPLSFAWSAMTAEGKSWMNGGLIFHGGHDGYGSGAAPTYAVSLDKADGWRLHT